MVARTRRLSPSQQHQLDTVPGLGRAVTALQVEMVNLGEKVDDHAASSERGRAILHNKFDGLSKTMDDRFDKLAASIQGLANDVLAKTAYVQGVTNTLNWGWGKITAVAGGLCCGIVSLVGLLAYYQPWRFLNGG